MPTVFTHGLVALALAAKARDVRVKHRNRLLLACALCAMLPDIDYFGLKLSIQYNSLFGHRGFTHSFFFAALVALVLSRLFQPKIRENAISFLKIFLLIFSVTASHGLLDAMTDGGEGVAFFSPFSNHRYFFSYRPIMVSPLGLEAFFRGWRGILVLLDEFLIVICPLVLALYYGKIWNYFRNKKPLLLIPLFAWGFSLSILTGLYPLNNISMTIRPTGAPVIDLFGKQYKNPYVLGVIPTYGIPDGKLVTNFLTFQRMGLFNRRLETNHIGDHWASGFFSNWYGGIAGRWQDSNITLLLRTFFGYGVPDSREVQELLKEAKVNSGKRDFLFRLAPTEKYDLAVGDYSFASTRSILALTHNAAVLPKFWYGICNGMAAAAKWYEEPFRTVDVINPNGFPIRFHPTDVKALLGYSLANAALWTELGTRCDVNGPDADACRVNPGAFFLATMNRIGLAHDSFIADGFSGTRKQFYLFDAVRVEVLKGPVPASAHKEWALPTPVKYLTEVRFTMDFVSTLLSDKEGSESEDQHQDKGYYKKVGRVVVPRVLEAILALDQEGNVIGGSWLGHEDVPDIIFFPGYDPATDSQGRLSVNQSLNWRVIKRIYEQSISQAPERAPLDFSL